MSAAAPSLSVVIVSYDSAAELPGTLAALVPQLGSGDELIVVDNNPGDGSIEAAREAAPAVTVVESGGNVGFAGGCNRGAAASDSELLLFLNPDTEVAPGCIDALRAAAGDHPGWAAWQPLVTMDDGTLVNTAGNVVHLLGLSWAGRCGESRSAIGAADYEAAFASGAALVVRRAAWEEVGGFDERFFMYCEDLDLSLRLRLAGWGVGVVPGAVADHRYEFGKGGYKWFLLERNRWWTILGTYPARVLVPLLPVLLAFELALLPVAAAGGWLGHKLRAQAAVVRSLPQALARRREIQSSRKIAPAAFFAWLTADLDSPYLGAAARVPGVGGALRALRRAVGALQ